MRPVDLADGLGYQGLNGRAEQLVALIAEQRLHLVVDEADDSRGVHSHQGIRQGLEQVLAAHRLRRHLVPLRAVTDNPRPAAAQISDNNSTLELAREAG